MAATRIPAVPAQSGCMPRGIRASSACKGEHMAIGLFVVRATIAKEKEDAYNRWYNEEHLPQVLRYNGAVSGRRYRRIAGDDKYDYMAVSEFASEAVLQTFLESDALKDLRAEYDKHFGAVSERVGSGWAQVFP
jgi:hypothetical protein